MKFIGKKELIDQLRVRYGYIKKSSNEFIDDFTDLLIWNMEQGNVVNLAGVGYFDIKKRKARKCMHPTTGDDIEIPEHWVPKFQPALNYKNAARAWEESLSDEELEKLDDVNTILTYIRQVNRENSDEYEASDE